MNQDRKEIHMHFKYIGNFQDKIMLNRRFKGPLKRFQEL